MKPGTSTAVKEAEQVILEHHDAINRHWRSLVGKLADLRRQYTGELVQFGILSEGDYIKNSYVAARDYGCNIEEAQQFTIKLM